MRIRNLRVLSAAVTLTGALAVAEAWADETTERGVEAMEELVTQGQQLAARIREKVDARLPDSPHALFARHLRSTAALVRADWVRAELATPEKTRPAEQFMKFATVIDRGLDGSAGTWEPYACGSRALNMAFVSAYDNTLQQYTVQLPTAWDPERAYPVVVYLHGYSPQPSIWYTSLAFALQAEAQMAQAAAGAENASQLPTENDQRPGPPAVEAAARARREPRQEPGETGRQLESPAPAMEPHSVVAPWGRGHTGYRDAGEADVWEALADFRAAFRTDEDRLYLCGHSMGGFGTWQIGTRTPDRWAALGIYAGGMRPGMSGLGLAGNAAHLPILLWHGAQDRTIPVTAAYALRDELRMVSNEPTLIVDPEAGHMVPSASRAPNKAWLLQHRRQRPTAFSFVADTREHGGVWGVTLRREPAMDSTPRFQVRVEKNTVYISSKGTTGLQVRLGPDGLCLDGEVTVLWNGEEAYAGPAETIQLGTGVPSRPW